MNWLSRRLEEADLSPRQFAELTGWNYRSVVSWCKGAAINRALRDAISYGLEELRDEGSTLNLKGLKERLGHHAPKSGKFVGSAYSLGL